MEARTSASLGKRREPPSLEGKSMGYPLEIHGIPGEIHGNPGENPWKSRGNLLEIRIFCCVIIGFLSVAPGKFCSLNSLNQFCDPFFRKLFGLMVMFYLFGDPIVLVCLMTS